MTKIEKLEAEIEALKERIVLLEARPQYVPMPYPVPPPIPPSSHPNPWIRWQTTSGNGCYNKTTLVE